MEEQWLNKDVLDRESNKASLNFLSLCKQSVLHGIKWFNYVCIIVFVVEINEYMNFKCENDRQLNLRWINTLREISVITVARGRRESIKKFVIKNGP